MFHKLSRLIKEDIPFLFYTDFSGSVMHCYRIDELKDEDIEFQFHSTYAQHRTLIDKTPKSFKIYQEKFDQIIEHIKNGDTYLLNFTQETPIKTNLTLPEIFSLANAPYKLRVKDQFVCFSPECFIRVTDNTISTYPMKGTIDAAIHNAEDKIMNDEKEMAEHVMVVDLLRNDLGMVAKNIKVERFRYIDKIKAGEKELLQISSKISGELPSDWKLHFGNILKKLLPAGSISGTPKKSTVNLIKEIENYERGFFTGIVGIFDGKDVDSAVMIRFIENKNKKLFYKSGGGITLESNAKLEYQELIDKIYIP